MVLLLGLVIWSRRQEKSSTPAPVEAGPVQPTVVSHVDSPTPPPVPEFDEDEHEPEDKERQRFDRVQLWGGRCSLKAAQLQEHDARAEGGG